MFLLEDDDIIKFEGFGFNNFLIDEKSYENILIYDISCKSLIGSKPLRIIFDKIDGYDMIWYLLMLWYLLKQFIIKIKITTAIRYF